MTPREIMSALAAPFAPDAVSWRVGSTTADKSKGMALAYIDARDVQDRLDEAVGPMNWRDEYQEVNGFLICKLWVRIGDEWNWKCDGAGKTDVEGEKGMVSDSFKRSAVKWGIGRYLYSLDSPWVKLNGRQIDKGEYPRLRALLERNAGVAQRLEQGRDNPQVAGSTPAPGVNSQPKAPVAQERPSKPSAPSAKPASDWEARERKIMEDRRAAAKEREGQVKTAAVDETDKMMRAAVGALESLLKRVQKGDHPQQIEGEFMAWKQTYKATVRRYNLDQKAKIDKAGFALRDALDKIVRERVDADTGEIITEDAA